ncbi:hypothetical protein J7T55_008744 [Diaporthe amygdali]|uniref:uncharacterized protein n=1 Tax=Phomopsis amygdali TaxID=1214568 RepID=UPI0022FDF017|nr:uncharacterized protein J7T55_008744 [Diaporthe amygdali]KAJ0121579.1 hypothetical protein J7T55_008744 [Diaporthe amygdali]
MKTPVLIVVIASVVVLSALPALYLFLAYHTHREREGWKTDHDRALEKIEHEVRRSRRLAGEGAAGAASGAFSSAAPGRAPSSVQQQRHHPRGAAPAQASRAPPREELNVPRSSRNHLSQASSDDNNAPRAASKRGRRPAPSTRRRSIGAGGGGRSIRGSEQQNSAHEATSDDNS